MAHGARNIFVARAISGFHICFRLQYSVGLGVFLGVLALDSASADEPELPHIVEPVFRFADTVPPTEIRHVFVLANPGDTEQKLARVRSTCGCTTAGVEPETIPPGGEARVEVVFSPGKRAGKQRKRVFIALGCQQRIRQLCCTVEGALVSKSFFPDLSGSAAQTPAQPTELAGVQEAESASLPSSARSPIPQPASMANPMAPVTPEAPSHR